MKTYALLALASLATASPDFVPEELDKRVSCADPAFALGSAVAAAGFWVHAGGVCPATANDGNINNSQCALDSIFGVCFSLLTGFSLYGIYHAAGRRDLITLPINDTSHVEGYAVTLTSLGNSLSEPYPVGDGWAHYQVYGEDLTGEGDHVSNVLSVREDGYHRITQPVVSADPLDKRSSGYTTYLAYKDGKTATFNRLPVCKTKAAAKTIAISAWNYGHRQNLHTFCADLTADGQHLDSGEISVQNTAFTDDAGNC